MVLKYLFFGGISLILVLLVAVWQDVLPPRPECPTFEKQWFGKGQRPSGEESKAITPFKIKFSDEVSNIDRQCSAFICVQ
jgi:hypothetical protein